MPIVKRPYRLLADCPKVYDFLNENYTRNWRRGVPGPYFEYAQSSAYFQPQYAHRIALWEDGGRIVAMTAYESTLGEAYFCLSDGYEFLIDEMLDHAESHIHTDTESGFAFFSEQTALREAAAHRGYVCDASWPTKCYDYAKGLLSYPLPEGFHMISTNDSTFDPVKLQRCCWKGFNHEAEGEMIPDPDSIVHTSTAPHFCEGLACIVVAPDGEYVCYGGMWFVPETRLAYLEPLCTVPQYRRRGLAAAVISELYRRTKALGADHMTGGSDPFYSALGFEPWYTNEIWHKQKETIQ